MHDLIDTMFFYIPGSWFCIVVLYQCSYRTYWVSIYQYQCWDVFLFFVIWCQWSSSSNGLSSLALFSPGLSSLVPPWSGSELDIAFMHKDCLRVILMFKLNFLKWVFVEWERSWSQWSYSHSPFIIDLSSKILRKIFLVKKLFFEYFFIRIPLTWCIY